MDGLDNSGLFIEIVLNIFTCFVVECLKFFNKLIAWLFFGLAKRCHFNKHTAFIILFYFSFYD